MCKNKMCSKCGRKLPLTSDYFSKRKNSKDGFRGVCKECRGQSFKHGIKSENINNFKKCRCCKEIKKLNSSNFNESSKNSDGFKNTCISCQIKNRGRNTDLITKHCIKCNKILPINELYFKKDDLCLDGFRNVCKECEGKEYGENRGFNFWSKEEDNLLIKLYPVMSIKDLEDIFPNHTYYSIGDRARKHLKLIKDENYIPKDAWTNEEDKYLIDNYSSNPLIFICEKINRTPESIVARASKLGVSKDLFWSKDEINLLATNYPNMSTYDLKLKYLNNRTLQSINNQARKLGLYKSVSYLNSINKSNGESIVSTILDKYNIKYEREYTLNNILNNGRNKLRMDFYIKSYGFIEYQGIQHYEPVEFFGGFKQFETQQYNDDLKRDYCLNNEINLMEIPYWEINNIESILIKELNLDKLESVI